MLSQEISQDVRVSCEKCSNSHDSIQSYVECTGQMVKSHAMQPSEEGERGKVPYSWTNEATLFLLEKVKNKWHRLNGKKEKRKSIWKEVANEMKPMIQDVTENNIEFKWKNLRASFVRYDVRQKSDRPLKRRPPYFDKISEIIHGTPSKQTEDDDSWILSVGTLSPPATAAQSIILPHEEEVSIDIKEHYFGPVKKVKRPKHSVVLQRQELTASINKLTEEVKRSNKILAQHMKDVKRAEEDRRKNEERMIQLLERRNDILEQFSDKS